MKLTLSQRVGLLIGVVVFGIAALTGALLYQMETVFDRANYAHTNTVGSIATLDDLREGLLQVQIQVSAHVTEVNPEHLSATEARIKHFRQQVEASISRFGLNACLGQPCIVDEKDRDYFYKIKSLWPEYDAAVQIILSESRKGTEAQLGARDLLESDEFLGLAAQLNTVIEDQINHHIESGRRSAESALAAKSNARTASLVIGVLIALLAGLLIRYEFKESTAQEARLLAARDQLMKASEIAELGIWAWNLGDGKMVLNERMLAMYDLPANQPEGKYYEQWRSRIHPDDVADVEAKIEALVQRGITYSPVFRLLAADGKIRYIHAAATVERDTDGKALRLLGVNRDITEQRQLEQVLRESIASAEAASKAKSDFLATMSHEIRTPMNAILGMLQLLARTELTERQSDYATKAETATKALLGIINDILDFSKVEAGKLEIDNQEFVLGDLLRELSVILSANLRGKPIEILFDLDSTVPAVLIGDPLRLRQVLLNLAGNAIKFTEEGEVVLSIRRRNEGAGGAGDNGGQGALTIDFAVKDSGIGIAPNKLAYIFQGFSQAESSTSRRFGGTGLGLAISKRLVELMGGELTVESEPGQGSCFRFSLPFAVGESAHAEPVSLTVEGRPLHALIVDDNATARMVAQNIVQSMGWHAECAETGEAALARLDRASDGQASENFDVVLVDWHMGGMDGWETARQLRQRMGEMSDPEVVSKSPLVIMVSSSGHEVFAQKSRREIELLDGYLVKPITGSMLYDSVVDARAHRTGSVQVVAPVQDSRRLEGLRLLVVEDNLINQQIALELLGHSGAQVEIAGGGIEGVSMALNARQAHDAILMDMQMPDIDGLEATRRIRAEPQMLGVPIIAMTANALDSDKEACRAVGMVDHVSKPIDLKVLIDTLLRHVTKPVHAPFEAVANEVAVSPAPTCGAISSSLLDIDTAVARLGGMREFYDQVLRSFRADAPLQLNEVSHYLAQDKWGDAVRCAHTLKGLASTIGATRLAQAGAELESMLKQPDRATDELDASLRQIRVLLSAVLDEVAGLVPELPDEHRGAPTAPAVQESSFAATAMLDKTALHRALDELGALLQTSNMHAIAVCAQVVTDHGSALSPQASAQLQALDASVNQLDFAGARTHCAALAATLT
ncbi:MAG: response regulator [Rhodocyclaceae bacterium]|nr:response regulator [Rhodocyclaceae bacterium]